MERLQLSGKKLFQHYGGIPGFFLIYPIFVIFIYIEFFFYHEPGFHFGLIVYCILIIWILWNQYSVLNFREVGTALNLEESKAAAKYAIESLKWELRVEEESGYEIYNFTDRDIRNLRGEMITVKFKNNSFLITSICKLDTIKPQLGFTFGKNQENKDNFISFYKEYEEYLKSH